jgi:hypothetical protein
MSLAAKRVLAEFAHNCVAHPLLFWTRKAPWATAFHDWTSRIAWPKTEMR